MGKQSYVTPSLTTFGDIHSITGTVCWNPINGSSKGMGYPSDTWNKFIPICDMPDDQGPDPDPGTGE